MMTAVRARPNRTTGNVNQERLRLLSVMRIGSLGKLRLKTMTSNTTPVHQPHQLSSPRRNPLQARSRHTLECIVLAAREVLAAQGPSKLTTQNVADRAGVSIGTVYEYFPNKRAIIFAVALEILKERSVTAQSDYSNLMHSPLPEFFAGIYSRMVEVEQALHELGGEGHRESSRFFQLGGRAGEREFSVEEMVGGMKAILQSHRAEVGETNIELAAQLLARGIRAMLVSLVEDRPDLLAAPELLPSIIRIASAIAQCKS